MLKLVRLLLQTVVAAVGLSVLVSACGDSEPSRIELLQENPMANPVLSFVEPVSQTGKQGSSGGLVGLDSETVHTTRFEFDSKNDPLAFEELTGQAVSAGFELELITHDGGLPHGTWQGTNGDGYLLSILVSPGRAQVELR